MLGWYVGRRMRRNVIRDVRVAETTMLLATQAAVARHVVQKMAFVEEAARQPGFHGVLRAAESVLRQAVADRHTALARGARSYADPAWNAASLVESWAGARLGSLNGRISKRAFERVDRELWRFVSDTLDPVEIAKVAGLDGAQKPVEPKPTSLREMGRGYDLIGWKSEKDELIDEAESIRRWQQAQDLALQRCDGLREARPERVGMWARLFRAKRRKNY